MAECAHEAFSQANEYPTEASHSFPGMGKGKRKAHMGLNPLMNNCNLSGWLRIAVCMNC